MAQLLIQSRGIAPVESFTLLGASMSRDEDGLIGQFGSGAKLAITTLLRKGLTVNIYCGLTRLEFRTKVITISDDVSTKQEQQVYIKFHGSSRKKLDLGWTLGFGAMDWQDEAMAIREFVANAIDHTVKQGDNVRDAYTDRDLAVEIVPNEHMKAQAKYTRVFIEANDVCQDYVDNLHHHFLHFSRVDLGCHILPKLSDRKKAQIYYNGVFVCELDNSSDSLCDYNFTGSQIKIDESRNLDEHQARAAIGRLYRDSSADDLVILFTALSRGIASLETGLDAYYLNPDWTGATDKQKGAWQEAWQRVNGDAIACGDDQGIVGEYARRKGHDLSIVNQSGVLDAIKSYGIPSVGDVLSKDECAGRTITPPSFAAIDGLNKMWDTIGMTNLIPSEREKPKVKGFDEIVNAESECFGFYELDSDTIHIRNDLDGDLLLETVLEELAHYLTGSEDCSRDLQSFAFRLFVRWTQ